MKIKHWLLIILNAIAFYGIYLSIEDWEFRKEWSRGMFLLYLYSALTIVISLVLVLSDFIISLPEKWYYDIEDFLKRKFP